jgi:hypothetical protein
MAPIEKLMCSVAMWIGRLEIVTIMALLHPLAWRDGRWADPDVVRRRLPKVQQHRDRLKLSRSNKIKKQESEDEKGQDL